MRRTWKRERLWDGKTQSTEGEMMTVINIVNCTQRGHSVFHWTELLVIRSLEEEEKGQGRKEVYGINCLMDFFFSYFAGSAEMSKLPNGCSFHSSMGTRFPISCEFFWVFLVFNVMFRSDKSKTLVLTSFPLRASQQIFVGSLIVRSDGKTNFFYICHW